MDYTIKAMPSFTLVGFAREFSFDSSYREIPRFWDEIMEKYRPGDPCEKAMADNAVGEFGVCIDDMVEGRFRYLIAGSYRGGELPAGMELCEFPGCDWAVFDSFGPMPDALQKLNTFVFQQWLPDNPDYDCAFPASIEWYDSAGQADDPQYHSAIWIPVKKKA